MRCLFQWICPLADKINRIRRSVFKQDQWCMPWFRNCPSDTQVQGVPEQSTVPALGSRQCPAPCSQQRCTGGTDSSADWIKLGGSLLGQVQGNKCIHKYLILTILKQKAIFPGLSFLLLCGDSTPTGVWADIEIHSGILSKAPEQHHSQCSQRNFTANSTTHGRTVVPKSEEEP